MYGLTLRSLLLCTATVVLRVSCAAGPDELPLQMSSSLPPEVLRLLGDSPEARRVAPAAHLNPFYVHGDFNGDGRIDTAVLVKNKASGKIGLAIVDPTAKSVTVIGAGRTFGNGGDDFSWMDAWRLFPHAPVGRGSGGGTPPALTGDALMVMKTESASALIYWTGKRYAWYQQGD
jgi:hypothetical protein